MGFGAGVSGRGAEFIQDLETQKKALADNRKRAMMQDAFTIQRQIEAGDYEGPRGVLQSRLAAIKDFGGDPSDSQGLLDKIDAGDYNGAYLDVSTLVEYGRQTGQFTGMLGKTAGEREFDSLAENLTPEDRENARRIQLGLDPRATGSAAQTITDKGTAVEIAATESILSEGREGGKSKAQLKYKPMIARAVKLAEKAAAARGETLTDLSRAEAGMPGLRGVVADLKLLAPLVTHTLGGKLWNVAVKETGFGSTKGGTARASFVSIINNQVLPLLKQTFGGSFSIQEGQELKASMGDPNSTPEEKAAQLDAFIAQKERDIKSKGLELGGVLGDTPTGGAPASKRLSFNPETGLLE